MRILFTGGSSFTGYHFASALAAAGHEVVCTLQRAVGDYSGLRGERVNRLKAQVRFAEHTSFGEAGFLSYLGRESFDLLCHHGADVTNYKSADFDPIHALENNCRDLPKVLTAFKNRGGKGLVLTGTIFEPDEGQGEPDLRAFSPYGLSKGLTWQVFRYYCEIASVALGKFVLPNPFGPYEEPRFTAYLMDQWKHGRTAQVRTPDYIRDSCHVSLLALAYASSVQRVGSSPQKVSIASPSGYVETVAQFTARVASEVRKRSDWSCEFELLKQTDFSEPMTRSNREPVAGAYPAWSEAKAWEEFVEFYRLNRK